MLRRLVTALTMAAALSSCQRGTPEGSTLDAVPYQVGTLFIAPGVEPLITGGVLQYRIYETGRVTYTGDISYFGSPGSTFELQVPFSGRAQLPPEAVRSNTYRDAGRFVRVNKVELEVDVVEELASRVTGRVVDTRKVDSTDASGTFRLDTTSGIVSVIEGDVTGTIFEGSAVETRIRLKLTR